MTRLSTFLDVNFSWNEMVFVVEQQCSWISFLSPGLVTPVPMGLSVGYWWLKLRNSTWNLEGERTSEWLWSQCRP